MGKIVSMAPPLRACATSGQVETPSARVVAPTASCALPADAPSTVISYDRSSPGEKGARATTEASGPASAASAASRSAVTRQGPEGASSTKAVPSAVTETESAAIASGAAPAEGSARNEIW